MPLSHVTLSHSNNRQQQHNNMFSIACCLFSSSFVLLHKSKLCCQRASWEFFFFLIFPPLGAHGVYCSPQLQCSILLQYYNRNSVYSITLLLLKRILDLCMAAGPYPKDNVYKSHPQSQTWAAEVSLLVVHKMFALLICHSLTRYLFSLPFCWSQRRSPVSVPFFRLPGVKPYVTCFLFPFAPYLAFGLGRRRQYILYSSGFSCWGNCCKMLEIYTYKWKYEMDFSRFPNNLCTCLYLERYYPWSL